MLRILDRPDHECLVASWCEEAGQHDRHIAYVGSMVATDMLGKPVTIQVVAESLTDKPKAALIFVDSRDMRMGAEVTWKQARQVAALLRNTADRFRP